MDGNDRSKRVLAALVRQYIATGEPIASAVLVTSAGLGVSSATVRHLLVRLEDEGYLHQPHTSARRVPTDLGYRFYVDLLLEQRRPRRSASRLEARLRRDNSASMIDSRVCAFLRSRNPPNGLQDPPVTTGAVCHRLSGSVICRHLPPVIVCRMSQVDK